METKKLREDMCFLIHQYLEVKLGDDWVAVDVGEKQRGMKIGKHLKYFG